MIENGVLGFRVIEFGCGVLGSGVVAEADLLLVDTIYLQMAGTVSFPITNDGGFSREGEIMRSKLKSGFWRIFMLSTLFG